MSQDTPIAAPRGTQILPLLPVRDGAIFPFIITPLTISRGRAILAADAAMEDDTRMVFLVSQKDQEMDEPSLDDFYQMGTVALIMRMLKFPDGKAKVLLQGLSRARLVDVVQEYPHLEAAVKVTADMESNADDLAVEALMRNVRRGLERLVAQGRGINPEVQNVAATLDDPGQLADLVASNLKLRNEETQEVLEFLDPVGRLRKVAEFANREAQVVEMQQELSDQVQGEMDRSQREYFLRQQLRAIQDELGEGSDLAAEVESLRERAEEVGMPEEARQEFDRNLQRLERLHPDAAETAIIRNYLETMIGLPWTKRTSDNLDLQAAWEVLDADHYGLQEVKERILEFLAVLKLKPDTASPILCFVGPPGVGKTSLGRSIARSLGREFVRISLGGVRDEAEIRGHRRTYVGAMPGRIIQGMQQAGTVNPVFMLDEVDKIGADFRGDPSAALLEVLDPEQNCAFRDHYLGVPYDLTKVMFITTANLLEPIQPAFRDRMEVIRLSGYTEEEKIEIARRHLMPRQLGRHGLTAARLRLSRNALRDLISGYTYEAGVRNLERSIARVCRKTARAVAEGKERATQVTAANLDRFLGPPLAERATALSRPRVGVATGLAVTANGGNVLFVEVLTMPGTGRLILTGQLGDVMKESAQAALSYARCHARDHDVPDSAFTTRDFHIHVPEGGIPKDGPSAGVTIATALLSALTERPVRRDLAMTGEITLRGTVLPVGGIKEKVLAAHRAGIRKVLVPQGNRKDLQVVPPACLKGVDVVTASDLDQVFEIALLPDETSGTRRPSTAAPRAEEREVA